ncbi:polyribonucleotide nucleotidyltransferase [Hypnocyclicus thermotrophus]|uniref:Polyribonucleotide nucleotidyltransferase n=1 Tax=Hypnocyclicus thermotrophus TaxID=1627895 RepID=A0AA46DZL5_9FUSO|nr:polyribonucleotide nucleotidyltransferase [Hypnocyclicus thermotrophus]TDT71902.1 polyribonucleotide nucleotidyltransferase [Hypnocyclicus thermotrophus]
MFDEKILEMDLAGRKLTIKTGKIARQAHGSVLLEYGETVLLATATRSKEPREGATFFPLTVDYIEKFYAAGKVPGGFVKREGKPSVDATLISRLIDRPIRPLFPENFFYDIHIVVTTLSYDEKNTPDYLGIIAASAALTISDIPFSGPVSGVVVGKIDGELVLNPTPEELATSDIHLSVAGTKEAVTMVEAGANEVSEKDMLEAIMFGHENIKIICEFQEEFQKLAGKEKITFDIKEIDKSIKDFVDKNGTEELKKAIKTEGKQERYDAIDALEEKLVEEYKEEYLQNNEAEEFPAELEKDLKNYYHDLMKKLVRDAILYDKYRADGRNTTDIRPLAMEIGVLPRTHGSALFTRGETQSLATATLGTKEDEQLVDSIEGESYKKFFLHYNFPPYSVGETGFMRALGRRELGHGSLAERALKYVIPSENDFPYTIRVVSDITESNGSSSQASICAGSLALMSAGVPIKSHVAGIAMGLIKEDDDYIVLTDIMGLEDHLGDMDFKVAGTKKGITALQMDIKIEGITKEIMEIALKQALDARLFILEKMENTISEPNEISKYAPRIHTLNINPEKISLLIGPAGKNIKAIIDETGAKIDIEDNGRVSIFTNDGDMLEKTIKLINNLVKEIKVDEIYIGKVTKLMKFGAFIELLPGKEGLLHISEIANERTEKVEDVLKVGDEIEVKVISTEKGKINVSRKALLKK